MEASGTTFSLAGTGGTGYEDLTPAGVNAAWGPVWSPDGSRIAFYDETKLKMVNADDTGLTEIAQHIDLVQPAWSPGGSRIVYLRYWDNPERAPPLFAPRRGATTTMSALAETR